MALIVIAALLAWNTLSNFNAPGVYAQSEYAVEILTANWSSKNYQASLASAINAAAKGRELVTIVPHDQAGKYLAIYK